MPNLKTTPEERAALRGMMQPGTLDHALGLAPKAALMLLDDLDTLAAEVGMLEARSRHESMLAPMRMNDLGHALAKVPR